jgi:hypothetical protein
MVVPNPYSPPTNILGKLTNHRRNREKELLWKAASSISRPSRTGVSLDSKRSHLQTASPPLTAPSLAARADRNSYNVSHSFYEVDEKAGPHGYEICVHSMGFIECLSLRRAAKQLQM